MLTAQLGTANSFPMNVQLGTADCSGDFTAQLGTLNSYPMNIILGIEDTCPSTGVSAGPFTYTLTASNTLVMTETVARNITVSLGSSNTITFTEKTAKGAVAFNVLSLNQQALGSSGIPAINTLVLVQTVTVNTVLNFALNQFFLINQWKLIGPNTISPTAINVFGAQQTLARNITVDVTASNNFVPVQSNEAYEQYEVDQTLIMAQVTTTTKASDRLIAQSINFNQIATYSAMFGASASNQINFIGGFTKVSEIAALSVTIPEVQVTKLKGKIIIQSETGVIVLPRPILGDTENCEGTLVVKYAITGDVYTYVRKTDLRKLKYSFLLERKKSLELKQFVAEFNFLPVILSNWKGETWFGCIVTDPLELIPKSRWLTCGEQVDVTFEFEGLRIN